MPLIDIVERLRAFIVDRGEPTMPINVHPTCCIDGADEIVSLRAELDTSERARLIAVGVQRELSDICRTLRVASVGDA
jgi:hypothetical protein